LKWAGMLSQVEGEEQSSAGDDGPLGVSRAPRGEFLPATTLTLRALADRLGSSVMPIREAVSRLAAEHAVELRPNRAIRVPDSSRTIISGGSGC
jgi:regulatory GntR family protein